ncbi:MAG: pimeloyl-ACP methyl ester carboxylesterase [Planctomycetaceae bacterium]|jgi:pimeloyl-ACP methyl ester carboxylesterase
MADVPFTEVAKLPYRMPDQTVRYGSDPSQIADYWRSETVSPLLVFIHGGWPGTFDDLRAAMDKAITPEHPDIFLSGHSAGGHLALWMSSQSPSKLKDTIGLAAISDLHEYAGGTSGCEQATVQLMGETPEEVPNRYNAESPILLDPGTETLMIHGDQDRIVNIEQSKHFINIHSKTKLRILKNHGHFDLVDPRQETPNIIVKQIEQWLR